MTTELELATQAIGEMCLVIRRHAQTIADLHGALADLHDERDAAIEECERRTKATLEFRERCDARIDNVLVSQVVDTTVLAINWCLQTLSDCESAGLRAEMEDGKHD
jgi:hypothetical protein